MRRGRLDADHLFGPLAAPPAAASLGAACNSISAGCEAAATASSASSPWMTGSSAPTGTGTGTGGCCVDRAAGSGAACAAGLVRLNVDVSNTAASATLTGDGWVKEEGSRSAMVTNAHRNAGAQPPQPRQSNNGQAAIASGMPGECAGPTSPQTPPPALTIHLGRRDQVQAANSAAAAPSARRTATVCTEPRQGACGRLAQEGGQQVRTRGLLASPCQSSRKTRIPPPSSIDRKRDGLPSLGQEHAHGGVGETDCWGDQQAVLPSWRTCSPHLSETARALRFAPRRKGTWGADNKEA